MQKVMINTETVNRILDALAEQPAKQVFHLMNEIVSQLPKPVPAPEKEEDVLVDDKKKVGKK